MSMLRALLLSLGVVFFVASLARCDDPPSAVGAVMKLLRTGKVPEARIPAIIEIVGTRGNEHDLAFLLSKIAEPGWPDAVRLKGFGLLIDSAATRKVIPAGDLAAINPLILDEKALLGLRVDAVRFAAAAKVAAASSALEKVLGQNGGPESLQAAAIEAYVAIKGRDALPMIQTILAGQTPLSVRIPAVAAQAEVDPVAAAKTATKMLNELGPTDNAGPLVDAFLARKSGPTALAQAIAASPPKADVAKLALRHMYAVGRSDDALVTALGKAAGISDDPAPVTPELVNAVASEVEKTGDAARGEAVFRRADLSCMKCHAVSAAGGQVGPDLSAVGSISPIDYLVTSVLNPDAAIKEAYISRVVATADGRTLQGIVVDRSAEKLVLKDATGAIHTIAVGDIDEEIEGKSLMPKGLVKFMTRHELVDLVKFLSQLGRPGDYAIRKTARFQRYRVLVKLPAGLGETAPNDEQFEAEIARSPNWVPYYATVDGTVNLAEAAKVGGSPVVYLMGEFDVRAPDEIGLNISATKGVTVWLDDDSLDRPAGTIAPETGRHRITMRVDTREAGAPAAVKMELLRPAGSKAEFQVVDGA